MKRTGWMMVATLALGCDAGSDDSAQSSSVCDDATQMVATCIGTEAESPFTSCDAQEQEQAQDLIDQLEAQGCEGPDEEKADGLCKVLFWDPLRWCEDPPEALGPEPQGKPTQFPIILAHGFNTSTTNFWRFNDIDLALIDDGHDVVLGSVPPFDTPQVRATFLADQVDELLERSGAEKVNLVCFSMGGLDCRHLVSPDGLDFGDRVATITTISSPNRGSFVADVATGIFPDSDSERAKAIDAVATVFGATFSDVADDSHLVAALEQMAEGNADAFAAQNPDHPDVFYQSWAGFSSVGALPHPDRNAIPDACRDENGDVLMLHHEGTNDLMDPLLVGAAAFVAHGTKLLPNDGVSTVESSKYGLFRGCIPADHLDQVGQIGDEGPDKRTGFDAVRFYRNLAFDLADRGF